MIMTFVQLQIDLQTNSVLELMMISQFNAVVYNCFLGCVMKMLRT